MIDSPALHLQEKRNPKNNTSRPASFVRTAKKKEKKLPRLRSALLMQIVDGAGHLVPGGWGCWMLGEKKRPAKGAWVSQEVSKTLVSGL